MDTKINIMLKTGNMIPVENYLKGDLTPVEYDGVVEYDYIECSDGTIRNLFGDELSKEELKQELKALEYRE